MCETRSVRKGVHVLGNKTVLVGTERADVATSCLSSMTTAQLPTSSPRTAQKTAYAHGAQALLGSTAHVEKRWAWAQGDLGTGCRQKCLAQGSSKHSGVRTHQHTWSLLPLPALALFATLPGLPVRR